MKVLVAARGDLRFNWFLVCLSLILVACRFSDSGAGSSDEETGEQRNIPLEQQLDLAHTEIDRLQKENDYLRRVLFERDNPGTEVRRDPVAHSSELVDFDVEGLRLVNQSRPQHRGLASVPQAHEQLIFDEEQSDEDDDDVTYIYQQSTDK
jgi:hypothetical protein